MASKQTTQNDFKVINTWKCFNNRHASYNDKTEAYTDNPTFEEEWRNLNNSIIHISLLGPEAGYWDNKQLIITSSSSTTLTSSGISEERDLLRASWDADSTPILVLQYSHVKGKGWFLQLFSQNRNSEMKTDQIKYVQMGRRIGMDGLEMGIDSRPIFTGAANLAPAKGPFERMSKMRYKGTITEDDEHDENDEEVSVENSEEEEAPMAKSSRSSSPSSRPKHKLSKMERELLDFNAAGTSVKLERKTRGSNNSVAACDDAHLDINSAKLPAAFSRNSPESDNTFNRTRNSPSNPVTPRTPTSPVKWKRQHDNIIDGSEPITKKFCALSTKSLCKRGRSQLEVELEDLYPFNEPGRLEFSTLARVEETKEADDEDLICSNLERERSGSLSQGINKRVKVTNGFQWSKGIKDAIVIEDNEQSNHDVSEPGTKTSSESALTSLSELRRERLMEELEDIQPFNEPGRTELQPSRRGSQNSREAARQKEEKNIIVISDDEQSSEDGDMDEEEEIEGKQEVDREEVENDTGIMFPTRPSGQTIIKVGWTAFCSESREEEQASQTEPARWFEEVLKC